MTLRPSAFYAAAGLRTATIRPAIWKAVLANLSSSATTRAGSVAICMRSEADHSSSSAADGCQRELCGIEACNLNQ